MLPAKKKRREATRCKITQARVAVTPIVACLTTITWTPRRKKRKRSVSRHAYREDDTSAYRRDESPRRDPSEVNEKCMEKTSESVKVHYHPLTAPRA
jgi:hypothetical protein